MDDVRVDGGGGTDAAPGRPDNLVVVLLDSLNRHMLAPYGLSLIHI